MKPVLGFLFLLAGFTVGYLVLSGKLPASTAGSPSPAKDPASSYQSNPLPVTPTRPGPGNIHGGPFPGFPTMASLDRQGSQGGMR